LAATAPCRKKSGSPEHSRLGEATSPPISVSPALFQKFQRLIHQETGIWLGESKTALLCSRLSRRLRTLELCRLEHYYKLVVQPHQKEERAEMIDAITTNETRFFREAKHFEFLVRRALPRWLADVQQGVRPKTLRLWSAGCSSGEEPYSLAMLMALNLPHDQGWDTTTLATDISTQMLERGRHGIYSLAKSGEIPETMLKVCMLKGNGAEEGQMKVMPGIQQMVEFRKLNLAHDPYPPRGHFDVIFCRNVLIYFDLDSKRKVVEKLTRCLSRAGLLFVGHAENLGGINSPLRSVAPAVYARAGEESGF
jgi:chemotaxis protein methyltransferase CheR